MADIKTTKKAKTADKAKLAKPEMKKVNSATIKKPVAAANNIKTIREKRKEGIEQLMAELAAEEQVRADSKAVVVREKAEVAIRPGAEVALSPSRKSVILSVVEKSAEQKAEQKPADKDTAEKSTARTKTSVKREKIKKAKTEVVKFAASASKSVLFAASECNPFIASGGLADVIGSLPKAIAKDKNIDVRVILPLYDGIDRTDINFIGFTYCKLAWRNQYAGVFATVKDNVTYYFIDNEYYFKRNGIYGHFDDGERFAFFAKAVFEICRMLGFVPDVIHCHDWQTGLIPVYLKTLYKDDAYFGNVKTAFTIHNIEYQGKFDNYVLENVIGISSANLSLLEYNGCLNYMKGAIQCCDKLTTVSPTYAFEIMNCKLDAGLKSIIEKNAYKYSGILNGLDYDYYNPATDKALFKNFTAATVFEGKDYNKTELQNLLDLPIDKNIPIIAVITRLVAQKGIDLIKAAAEEILKEKVQFVIIGKGDSYYENYFVELQKIYSEKVRAVIAYNSDLARKLYASADIFLMPSLFEPCGLAQMISARYGTVSVIRETGGLSDSIFDVGNAGGGNGFTFKDYKSEELLNRVRHALSYYSDKPEWQKLVKKVMENDFSWDKSAEDYKKLYRELFN